jgi:drug/metabolite transporter (DMT)-like permease
MAVLLGLLSALCYGSSDFAAGFGGRRSGSGAVAAFAPSFGLAEAATAVFVLSAGSPTPATLWWGALSGVGSGVGTVALYRGLAVARMSVVAPVSAVLSAVLPAMIGILSGEHLAPLAWTGIIVAVPAIALVSVQPADSQQGPGAGILTGVTAGAGFALLLVALDHAGTAAGAWPLLPGQTVASLIIMAWLIVPKNRPSRQAWSQSWRIGCLAGVLVGFANLLFLAATGAGQLAIVAVVTSLYPAITVLLARVILREQWSRLQVLGLVICGAAITAISIS